MTNSDKGYSALGAVQHSMRSLQVPKRLLIALFASLAIIWLLLQSHRLYPLPSYEAIYRSDLLDDINNSTLGFEKIFVMGLPERTDRRDGMVLQASLSEMEIEFIDGPDGDSISEKAIPVNEDRKHIKKGALGCWRGHINALQEIVRRNITSALILEDDSDWDIRIRSLMRNVAASTQALTQPLRSDPNTFADSSFPEPQTGDEVIREFTLDSLPSTVAPKTSPYGDNWDLLWVGHCGMQFPLKTDPGLPMGRVIHKDDMTVPPKGNLWSFTKPFTLVNSFPAQTRAVHHAYEGVCSLGYAVSQHGARSLLREIALREVADPLDILLRFYCQGLHGRGKHNCLAVQPPLFNHHRVAGPSTAASNIGNHGDGYRKHAMTDMVQWSVRLHADAILEGSHNYTDQYPLKKENVEGKA